MWGSFNPWVHNGGQKLLVKVSKGRTRRYSSLRRVWSVDQGEKGAAGKKNPNRNSEDQEGNAVDRKRCTEVLGG